MENKNEALDLLWLDEAFSKGLVDELDAACCLAGCSPEEAQLGRLFPTTKHPSDILTPLVSKLYEIIITWPSLYGRKPLLWYIEQAVSRSTPHVKYDLLFEKCREGEYRQKEIVGNYPALAKKLGWHSHKVGEDASLGADIHKQADSEPGTNNKPIPKEDAAKVEEWKTKVWEFANEEAFKLYKTGRQKVSQRDIAPYVATRLAEEEIVGAQGPLDAESVRRHGLQGWKAPKPKK